MFWRKNKDRSLTDNLLKLAMEVDGHRLYAYKDVAFMPTMRISIVRLGYGKYELGVKPQDIRTYTKLVAEKINEGDLASIASMTNYLNLHLDDYCSTRVALEVGGYGVLVDDEPHDQLTDRHNAIKEELLRKHESVRGFFLGESVGHIANLNPSINPSRLKESLNHPHRIAHEVTFLNLIQQDIFSGLWTPLTPAPSGWQKLVASIVQKK